ncbi:24175_t:CDS:1, partial [Racocetra persica]
ENDEEIVSKDTSPGKVDEWKADIVERMKNNIYDSKPNPPIEGSIDIKQWAIFQNNLEHFVNFEPIKWDLVLLDNFLAKYSESGTLEEFKKYLEEKDKIAEPSKKNIKATDKVIDKVTDKVTDKVADKARRT